jgi:hypothetical protein
MDPGLTRKKLANHNGEGDAQSLKYSYHTMRGAIELMTR